MAVSDKQLSFIKEMHKKKCDFWSYKDGIYEITYVDYLRFYYAINKYTEMDRKYKRLIMLKDDDVFMFFIESNAGTISLLNGGLIQALDGRKVEFFQGKCLNTTWLLRGIWMSISCFKKRYPTK